MDTEIRSIFDQAMEWDGEIKNAPGKTISALPDRGGQKINTPAESVPALPEEDEQKRSTPAESIPASPDRGGQKSNTLAESIPVSPERVNGELPDREATVLNYALETAAAQSGARDPELLRLLLERESLTVENGTVQGLRESLTAIRRQRPYLFQDGGGRPRFSAETMDRGLPSEEETVAQRYRNNPWYRRR